MVIKRIIAGQIRHIFAAGGTGAFTWMINNGFSASDIEAVASATVAIVMAVWSAYDKYKEEKKKS
jgi:hypothetical protein